MSYDRALTVFSPDGKLFQIDYAYEAVKKGAATVGLKGESCIVLGVERKAVAKLQEARTIRKVVKLDDKITLAFAGLTADARVLVQRARVEAQSYRLTCEDSPSVEYMARYLAQLLQRYTQRGGVRPFGVSAILAGFSSDNKPLMYQIDPSGTYFSWKANAIGGRNAKSMREFLEKSWKATLSDDEATTLCIKTLLEVVDSGSKNMEIVVISRDPNSGVQSETTLSDEKLDAIIATIEAERDETKGASATSADMKDD
uniref:Proteasome subunit alpha type n=1 Tax=Aureoumbra lagunensis TaxID=44058 RepID=A0A7S3NRE4_9STRA|mmetsp:Transcript_13292/g.17751  ORF Transcript_13292/g.17751 Transcript_13292/m.17751 type:complete len:257 (-) Transcript_13292:1073-1843(-)|eukprot:CAMPEP_0197289164 /NCGR_PEP_ID=MMETSP0890-20130614/6373_1 /TAXON_ID=44058 ORGANISM="Aureoumbra lagunensis, Strain CCMP1510" /NCGR_SAMPLE_ID=MMETSP0890 /ASSEMBLY_ACC=CAM_ASM_000533 /LENGTH=256 /DNA_ID=CAMNT_0042760369 /DNA_START=217 /DNA_END=987 /DNA_ORIENTATION=-